MNLYVHVPFCARKCRYCAFYSAAAPAAADFADYLRLLPREFALRGLAGARPATVYLGGGTPSILGPEGLSSLLAAAGFDPPAVHRKSAAVTAWTCLVAQKPARA